jgi:hypothetical protein
MIRKVVFAITVDFNLFALMAFPWLYNKKLANLFGCENAPLF